MNINLWSLNYSPELTGIGFYSGELGSYLATQGHNVSVVTTFPYYPRWEKRPGDRRVLFRTDEIDTVKVHRCWHYVPKKPALVSRLFYEISFIITSILQQLFLPAPDVYVVVSPPLMLGLAAVIVSTIKGAPFVLHLQDMQLDSALGLGLLKAPMIRRILESVERSIYQQATRVSAITSQMCEALRLKGVPDSKIVLFPNWVQLPDPKDIRAPGLWKNERGIAEGVPLISYAGSLSFRQGMEIVIEVAQLLKDVSPAIFVIAGEGPEKDRLRKLANQHHLTNVLFEDVLSFDEHTNLLVDSDICLIPQRRGTGSSSFPSKLLKILALKCPVITNADTDSSLYEAVCEGGFGRTVDNEDIEALAKIITDLVGNSHLREQMAVKGRRFAQSFHKPDVLNCFQQVLSGVVAPRSLRNSAKLEQSVAKKELEIAS